MDLIQVMQADKQDENGIFDAPILGRGFRPFFLLGALFAVWSIAVWVPLFSGHIGAGSGVWDDMMLWHAHEMVFGFAGAIIAGFLLTAVPNWTGLPQVKGAALLLLCLLWLAGRVVMHVLPAGAMQALVDIAFLPVLAAFIGVPILRAGSRKNFVFLGLLGAMALCNVAMHFYGARAGLYAAFMIVMILISLIGGRVIPFFTISAMRMRGVKLAQTDHPKLDVLALLGLLGVAGVLMLTPAQPFWLAGAGAFAVVVHLLRLRHWHLRHAFRVPMLWILHLGYIWLVAGLALLAASGYWPELFFPALHAMAAGSIGSMTIGMMCRVARGHTGRDIIAGKPEIAMFVLIQLAALLRVFGPLLAPDMQIMWIGISGGLWCLCYAIYLPVYIPVMFSPRPDGRPA